MPANRPDRTSDEKSSELLAIALRLFIERGYAKTTIAAIAGEAGVASNVVHWYFDSKDELFAAAMEQLQLAALAHLEERFERDPVADGPKRIEALLLDMVERASAAHGLISTVHERANHSAAIAALHERAHERYGEFLRRLLSRANAPEDDLELTAAVLMNTIESLVVHRASEAESQRTLAFLVARLLS